MTDILDLHGASWRQWVINNLQRGCSPKSMFESMTKNTWSAEDAAKALDAGLSELAIERPWRVNLPQIPEADRIDVDGQMVAVLGRVDRPKAVMLDGVLSQDECCELIAYAESKGLKSSRVVDAGSGEGVDHAARTSTSVFLTRAETPLIARIEQRLAKLTGWPVANGEGLQVLRYEPGQQYKPHFDWFDPDKPGSAQHLKRGGQRVGTTVMYLANAQSGGATRFPKAGVQVTPKVGGAIFFQDLDPTGKPDDMSLHSGTPVEEGVKIVATYWQREGVFPSVGAAPDQ